MRIALQNTLALLALYLVLGICLIVVLRAELGAALFDRIYASVLLAALSGLGSIILVGALLQVQLKRMSAGLAALMEAVANGDTEALRQRDDEFSAVRDGANRLGNEITAARDKLDAVANVFDVGVILISPDGSPDYINQTARQILIGNRVQDFAARFTEMYVKLKEAIDKVCQGSGGERLTNIELTVGKAGVTKRLRVELQALGSADNRGCLLIVEDQDLMDALDEDLRAATQARGLSRLYAAAAHDLKAPLNAMNLNMEMLKRSLDADDANARPRREHYLKVIIQESARLNRLLNSLLEQSAPAAEGRTTVDLVRLIDELATLLTPQARHQQVTFDVSLPIDAVRIFGNAGQLKQALLNIILNALECVTENGRVGVSLRTEASSALIEIEDDGAGVPALLQPSIFDMHFTTKETGTGIGLYVARAVIERHGGEIQLQSRSGAGTRFILSLPLHQASLTAGQDAPPEINPTSAR